MNGGTVGLSQVYPVENTFKKLKKKMSLDAQKIQRRRFEYVPKFLVIQISKKC